MARKHNNRQDHKRRHKRKRKLRGTCYYCHRRFQPTGSLMYTRDHIEPAHNHHARTVPCCLRCNGLKGGMTYETWVAYMHLFPEWWKSEKRPYGWKLKVAKHIGKTINGRMGL